jgi:hypothetical protein
VYQTYTQIQNNQLQYCGADRVEDYPYANVPFDNYLLAQDVDCPPFSGNDDAPDDREIQCLLDSGNSVVLDADVTRGYIISTGLILHRSNTVLTSTTSSTNWALLWARSDLKHPILEVEDGKNDYTISKIWFYGNRYDRPCVRLPNGVDRDTTASTNLVLHGQGFVIDQVESDAAVCASGVSVEGSGYRIQNSWFAFNGTTEATKPQRGDEPWSDGLTVLSCANGFIEGNHFIDNTDIDLITANSINCSVSNNFIDHYSTVGYGGLMVSMFGPTGGIHTGTVYSGNVISSLPDGLQRGIIVGNHPWADNTHMDDVGSVQGNTASGAFFNLLIEADSRGVVVGQVTGNVLNGAQGSPPFGTPSEGIPCTIPSNYVVNPAHAGLIVRDPGWHNVQFDSSKGCIWIP